MQRVKRRSVKTSGLNAIRNVEKKTLNIVRNAWIKRIDRKQKNERNNKMKRLKILKQSKGGGGEGGKLPVFISSDAVDAHRLPLLLPRPPHETDVTPTGAVSVWVTERKKKKLIMKTGGNVAISVIKS